MLNVKGSISGNYFVCDFAYPNNTQNFSMYDDGSKWLDVQQFNGDSIQSNQWYMGTGTSPTYFNFTKSCTEVSINITLINHANPGECDLALINGKGQIIILINHYHTDAGHYNVNILGEGGIGAIKSTGNSGIEGQYRFILYAINKSINIIVTGGALQGNYWYTASNYFSNTVGFKAYKNSNSYSFYLDDIRYLYTVSSDLWELPNPSIGSVRQNGVNFSQYVLANQYYIIEDKYINPISNTLYLYQFALSVSTLTELTKMNIDLHINGLEFGYYDNYYSYSQNGIMRYCLVWNINNQFTTNDLLYEIEVQATSNAWFEYPYYTGDIDGDTNINFFQTGNSDGSGAHVFPYFNNVFDGDTLVTIGEFQYKIWYNLSGGTSTENIFNGLSYIGSEIPPCDPTGSYITLDSDKQTLEYQNQRNIDSALFYGMDFFVTKQQYDGLPSLNNYLLTVNNYTIGNPMSFTKICDNIYRLRFQQVTPLTLHGKTSFEILSISKYNSKNWYFPTTGSDTDLDGRVQHKINNGYNNVYDGDIQQKCDFIFFCVDTDLFYRIYYSDITYNDVVCGYATDKLTTETNTVTLGNSMSFYYELSTMTIDNYLYIYHTGDSYSGSEQGYPLKLQACDGSDKSPLFSPLKTGIFNAVIKRNNVDVSNNITFTVIASGDPNHTLIVYPDISLQGEYFNIYYEYLNNGGKAGEIRYGYDITDNTRIISDNENGTITNIFGEHIGIYYIKMYVEVSTGVYSLVQHKEHEIVLSEQLNSFISTDEKNYYLNANNNSVSVHIQGTKATYGQIGYVKLNNQTIYVVPTYTRDFNFNYAITKADDYTLTLEIIGTNGTYEIANWNFTVYDSKSNPISINGESIPTLFQLIIGFIIIAGMLSIPLIANIKSNADIPVFAYLIFAVVGLVIDVILFPTIFLPILISVIAIMCFAIIIMWLRGRSE